MSTEDIKNFEVKYKQALQHRKVETEEFLKALEEIERQFGVAEVTHKQEELHSEEVKESVKESVYVTYILAAMMLLATILMFWFL